MLPGQEGGPVLRGFVRSPLEVDQDVEGERIGVEDPGQGAAGAHNGHEGGDGVGPQSLGQVRSGGDQSLHGGTGPAGYGRGGHGLRERSGQVAHVGNVTGTVGSVRGWTRCGWPCAR